MSRFSALKNRLGRRERNVVTTQEKQDCKWKGPKHYIWYQSWIIFCYSYTLSSSWWGLFPLRVLHYLCHFLLPPHPPSPLPRRFSRVLLTESTNSFKLCALPEVTISSVIKNYICTQKLIPKIAKSQCRRVTLVSNGSGTVKQNLQSRTPQSSQDLLFT